MNGFLCWKRRWKALWLEGLPRPSDDDVRKTLWSAGQRELLGWRSWGELSSARQALECAVVALGDEKMWKEVEEAKAPFGKRSHSGSS